LGENKMKKFKIYSSEVVLYETIVEAESEDEACSKMDLNYFNDEVKRTGWQTDDIKEITDE
tara:strand:+ start:533 stop:715 length:183 start_codon:yes stop_codon:yes gene_type:complete